jgi:hypothetical protein
MALPAKMSGLSPLVMVTLLSCLWGIVKAQNLSTSAIAACSVLAGGSSETLSYPVDSLDYDYVQAKTHYWSAANGDLTPACVVFPTNAEEASYVIQVLQNYTDVGFAMKSGGHNPNVGFSSTDGGVLISFSKLATTTYNADSRTADIGPGARWAEVMSALEPYGVAVVGGRIGQPIFTVHESMLIYQVMSALVDCFWVEDSVS